ncbi:MAG: hypothetical protein ACLGSD_10085 [Acidobacteriota bacterium]
MAEREKNQTKGKDGSGAQGGRDGAGANPGGERVAVTAGGKPRMVEGDLARQTAALNASTDEEVDALRVNLMQDPRGRDTRNGTGKIVDEVAREHMAGMTEVGPELDDKGVVSAVPGRDNPSGILRRHHPNTEIARAQDVVEGNVEEPRDEARMERNVDDGTAA